MIIRPVSEALFACELTVRAVGPLPEGDAADRDYTTLERVSAAFAKTPGALGQLNGHRCVGLGGATTAECQAAGRKLVRALAAFTPASLELDLTALGERPEAVQAFLRGCHLGTYVLGQWREEKPEAPLSGCNVFCGSALGGGDLREVLAKAEALAAGQLAAMHLVDRPANAKKPRDVAAYVVELGRTHGFEVEVLDEEALEIQGFTGILAVGRASDYPPRLLKLHYRGGDAYHLGLVGKGITFDTGGISIKPSANMGFMKSDLGGAAAVLGTFVASAKLGLPVELHGLLGVAENAIDGDAYLPSDVVRNYGGKTIEITDTDAEGRIVLADALAYLPEWASPQLTIDLATLTGSAVRTFGYACAAAFTHDDQLVRQLGRAGKPVDERIWPLPLWDVYEADLKSDVADVKHFHGKPIAGAINAAKFLEYFVADKSKWVHLDIAGVAFGANDYAHDRSATGYGVALLTQFLQDRCDETA